MIAASSALAPASVFAAITPARRFAALALALFAFACATAPAPSSPSSSALPKPSPCPALDEALAAKHYEEGMRLLAESRDGEHYKTEPFDEAMRHLLSAAEAGHTAAQVRYGTTLFGVMFTNDAPSAAQEHEYVRALKFIYVAARRGHEGAAGSLPGWPPADRATIEKAELEQPLSDLPRAWLLRAIDEAEAWLECVAAGAGRPPTNTP